jgi:A/G-specific adenine glycosylase
MNNFSEKLITWYKANKRDLPWRNNTDPYKIWLSEIILQQTRVAQGLPYYLKFVAKYPTVQSLAEADEQEVLRLWQGLGYYSRARNMHAAAKFVINELDGNFPPDYATLKKLKGVGDYTAAAIASFAYKEKVAVVDGNVFRVLARLFGIDIDINSNEGKKTFNALANELISAQNPDIHNQAIMEFGALQCTPANPDCLFCPFTAECNARLTQQQNTLPVKVKKVKQKKRYFYYLVINERDKYFLKKRKAGDIWQGLYDFPLVESNNELSLQDVFKQLEVKESDEILPDYIPKEYKHILTHQIISAKFYVIKKENINSLNLFLADIEAKAYDIESIEALPKSVLVNKYLKEHIF